MELSKRKINDIVKAIALLEHVFVKYLLIDVNSNSNYMLLKTNITWKKDASFNNIEWVYLGMRS